MLMYFPKLCAPYTGISLTWWPPDNYINRGNRMPQLTQQLSRLNAANIPREAKELSTLLRFSPMEIFRIRPTSPALLLYPAKDLKPGSLKAERQASAPAEKIQDSGRRTLLNPVQLLVHRHSLHCERQRASDHVYGE
jgi:hypothetical protein